MRNFKAVNHRSGLQIAMKKCLNAAKRMCTFLAVSPVFVCFLYPYLRSTDMLSSDLGINFRMLDWEAALNDDRRISVVKLLEEANPEVIFGADIVC